MCVCVCVYVCVCVCVYGHSAVCVCVVRNEPTLCSQGNSMTSTAVSLQMRQLGADKEDRSTAVH